MNTLEPPLGRTLAIVAHPDDECIAFGALLQRVTAPTLVFCTDGAPRDAYFWKARYGSRERYADVRRDEARRALASAGLGSPVFLADAPAVEGRLVDQELFLNLTTAYALLGSLIEQCQPEALLTLAYEGGHPDHDSCNFLTSLFSRQFGIPAFESPLYHRARSEGAGEDLGVQRFVQGGIPVMEVRPTEQELARKAAMCEAYASQGDFLRMFDIRREVVRPLAEYDYRIPPHAGKLNYEFWGWSMTGRDVCAAFSEFLYSRAGSGFLTGEATGNSGRDSNLGRTEIL